jgi:hypothetical protein
LVFGFGFWFWLLVLAFGFDFWLLVLPFGFWFCLSQAGEALAFAGDLALAASGSGLRCW